MLTGVVKMSVRRHLTSVGDLSTAMRNVNRDIHVCTADKYFITACVGIWEPACRRWTYCAAGHPGGVLLRAGRTVDLPSTSPLLGVLPEGQWPVESVDLRYRDRIFLYTDGSIEAEINGEQFGLVGLRAQLERTANLDLSSQTRAVIQAIDSGNGGSRADDTTLLALEVARPEADRISAIG
jgi:serine phosphatase RsbU (regulator of sigma subunit)